jgi:hypothetical protein|tara:strand:+ start:5455 stop:5706 length:252 start_codon:yes stop_codon:yes gene_type:complete
MWYFLLRAIASGIVGSATAKWFETTSLGIWTYAKFSQFYNWAADRYNLKILETEEQWRKKYPNIAQKIDGLEQKIKQMENKNV